MAGQRTTFQSSKSTGGAAVAGFGMFILYLHLTAAVASLSHMLDAGGSAALALLVSVIPSALQGFETCTADHQQFMQRLLVSCWPVLLVVVGTVLARDSFTDSATPIPPKNNTGHVDLASGHSTSK